MNKQLEEMYKRLAAMQKTSAEARAAREIYDEENGISDGEQQILKAMEEARERLDKGLREKRAVGGLGGF